MIGASPRADRYSNFAVRKLKAHGHEVEAIGLRDGEIEGVPIQKGLPELENIDTVTLYVGPTNQVHYIDYILGLRPKRLILNPGTENPELEKVAKEQGIEVLEACTLVMLSSGQY